MFLGIQRLHNSKTNIIFGGRKGTPFAAGFEYSLNASHNPTEGPRSDNKPTLRRLALFWGAL